MPMWLPQSLLSAPHLLSHKWAMRVPVFSFALWICKYECIIWYGYKICLLKVCHSTTKRNLYTKLWLLAHVIRNRHFFAMDKQDYHLRISMEYQMIFFFFRCMSCSPNAYHKDRYNEFDGNSKFSIWLFKSSDKLYKLSYIYFPLSENFIPQSKLASQPILNLHCLVKVQELCWRTAVPSSGKILWKPCKQFLNLSDFSRSKYFLAETAANMQFSSLSIHYKIY